MAAWRRENIRLIRTIPVRFHESLRRRVTETFADRPFDQRALSKVLNREYRSTGYNLRRLTRDQTSKAIGQLTHARQTQLGVTEYRWRTAQDERVRETHATLDGTTHRWDTPPGVGHPGQDIQCRCVAIPVLAPVTGPPVTRKATPPASPHGVAEFVPQKLPETGLGTSYSVETDDLIVALGGADPRSPLGSQRVRDYVRTRGHVDGVEHLALVDQVEGSVHAGSSSIANQVQLVGSIDAALKTPSRRIVAYHNHPGSTALSGGDVIVLGASRGMQQIEAVAHNGSLSVARITDKIKATPAHGSVQFWKAAVDAADDATVQELIKRVNAGTMTADVANKTFQDIRNRVLAEVGAIQYTTTHAPAIGEVASFVSPKLQGLMEKLD